MTTTDLIRDVAKHSDLPKNKTKLIVAEVFNVITRELVAGNSVNILGFGTFEVSHRAARKGTNPRTGETIDLPASKLPYFRAGKALKRAVN